IRLESLEPDERPGEGHVENILRIDPRLEARRDLRAQAIEEHFAEKTVESFLGFVVTGILPQAVDQIEGFHAVDCISHREPPAIATTSPRSSRPPEPSQSPNGSKGRCW